MRFQKYAFIVFIENASIDSCPHYRFDAFSIVQPDVSCCACYKDACDICGHRLRFDAFSPFSTIHINKIDMLFLSAFKSVFKSFTITRFSVLVWTEGLKVWKWTSRHITYHLFLFNFQVGDNSFDLPEANVLIQVKCAQLIMSIEFKLRH